MSEQVDFEVGSNAVKPAGIGGQRRPAPLAGHVHDMAGQCVEHASGAEQLVHLGRGRRVELAEHN